jgi:hypothetical protein
MEDYDSLNEDTNLYNHVVVGFNSRYHDSSDVFRVFDKVTPSIATELPEYHVGDTLSPMDVAYLLMVHGQVDRRPHIIYTILTYQEATELINPPRTVSKGI